ncbi:MAG TPA: hypothetical protein VNE86_02155 [Nitrososphaerales archaeon]|nr:hypothetical protein [Nitrososphaerales archaeon]
MEDFLKTLSLTILCVFLLDFLLLQFFPVILPLNVLLSHYAILVAASGLSAAALLFPSDFLSILRADVLRSKH